MKADQAVFMLSACQPGRSLGSAGFSQSMIGMVVCAVPVPGLASTAGLTAMAGLAAGAGRSGTVWQPVSDSTVASSNG